MCQQHLVLYYLSGTPLYLLLFPCVSRRHFLFLANCFLLLFFCSSPKFSVSRRCFLFRCFLFLVRCFLFLAASRFWGDNRGAAPLTPRRETEVNVERKRDGRTTPLTRRRVGGFVISAMIDDRTSKIDGRPTMIDDR